jgi:hypothetical protein
MRTFKAGDRIVATRTDWDGQKVSDAGVVESVLSVGVSAKPYVRVRFDNGEAWLVAVTSIVVDKESA